MELTSNKDENESRSVMSDFLWPHELYSQWNSPGQNIRVGIPPLEGDPFSRGSSHPGIEPRSPALQANSLLAELQRKPLNFINTLQINRRLMSYDINQKIRSSFTITPFLSLFFELKLLQITTRNLQPKRIKKVSEMEKSPNLSYF